MDGRRNASAAFLLSAMALGALWAGAQFVDGSAAPVQPQSTATEHPILEACDQAGWTRAALGVVECGWYPVPEDRATPDGRWLRLRVVRVRSTARSRADDAIVRLVGGPGQGAASLASRLAVGHRARFPDRDLVLVDQRGTGESNGLFCAEDHALTAPVTELVTEVFPAAAIQACRASLAREADLSKYVTDIAADDLDEVLTWLQYERVTLMGGSYGTRVAQVFMRRHPDRVRAAVLDGVVPMDAYSPLSYSSTATTAMNAVVDACLAEPACADAFPDLRRDTDAVWRRLEQGPTWLTASDPRDGRAVRVRVPKHVLGYAVRGILYQPRQFVALPRLLHRAGQGDYRGLIDAYIGRKVGFSSGTFATGMYFSVFCSEGVPFITDGAAAIDDGVMGNALVANFRNICDGWPRADLPANWHDRVQTDHPVLVLSGEFDPVTTSDMGEAVASGFLNGLHVTVPGAGHGSQSNPDAAACARQIIGDFVRAGSTKALDVSCLNGVRRPEFQVGRTNSR